MKLKTVNDIVSGLLIAEDEKREEEKEEDNERQTEEIASDDLPFSSVQFSHSVVSDSLRPHESQQVRAPCLSPTPGVHSNLCPSS